MNNQIGTSTFESLRFLRNFLSNRPFLVQKNVPIVRTKAQTTIEMECQTEHDLELEIRQWPTLFGCNDDSKRINALQCIESRCYVCLFLFSRSHCETPSKWVGITCLTVFDRAMFSHQHEFSSVNRNITGFIYNVYKAILIPIALMYHI